MWSRSTLFVLSVKSAGKTALHYTVAYWEGWNLDTDYLTVTLEKRFSVKNTPSLIMIEYEPGEGVYLVHEQYCRFDGKGNVIEGGNRRNRKINALEEYEIPPDYSATVIIDLSGAGGQITAVSIPELRKKAHIGKAPFVFVGIAPAEDEREVTAEIGLIEKG